VAPRGIDSAPTVVAVEEAGAVFANKAAVAALVEAVQNAVDTVAEGARSAFAAQEELVAHVQVVGKVVDVPFRVVVVAGITVVREGIVVPAVSFVGFGSRMRWLDLGLGTLEVEMGRIVVAVAVAVEGIVATKRGVASAESWSQGAGYRPY